MILPSRAPLLSRTALGVAAVALAFLTITATATAIHYESETLTVLQGQLGHHEVRSVSFHPGTGTGHIHATLKDGRHLTVVYADSEQAQLIAQARAEGARVTIAKAKAKAAKKPAKHKLRYIAGGILVVVIIVVAAVLLVDRRRKLNESGADRVTESASASASGPSPPSDSP
jgi:hypothetical protein